MYASIDLLADKLDRQVQKHKEKALSSKDKSASIRTESIEEEKELTQEDLLEELKEEVAESEEA